MKWHIRICTVTGDHIWTSYRGAPAERKARRAFATITPMRAAGVLYVELLRGSGINRAPVVERKDA